MEEIRRKCPSTSFVPRIWKKQFQEFSIYARHERGKYTVANARGARKYLTERGQRRN